MGLNRARRINEGPRADCDGRRTCPARETTALIDVDWSISRSMMRVGV